MTTSNYEVRSSKTITKSTSKIVKVGNTIYLAQPKRTFWGGLSTTEFTYVKVGA